MESRELLRKIKGLDKDNQEHRVKLIKFTTPEALDKLLSESSVIIPALGYQPQYPPLFNTNKQALALGTIDGKYVDQECRLLQQNGNPVPNVYGVGLASGFVPDNGGEPSFKGQTNSIWIYQNPAGNILLDTILNTQERSNAVA